MTFFSVQFTIGIMDSILYSISTNVDVFILSLQRIDLLNIRSKRKKFLFKRQIIDRNMPAFRVNRSSKCFRFSE